MSKVTIETIYGTLTDEQIKLINEGIKEISVHQSEVDRQKQFIKDIISNLYEESKLPKKQLNKMAKSYHKKSFVEETTEQNEFQELYSAILQEQE